MRTTSTHALSDDAGLTIVESLVAMVVALIVIIGLTQSVLSSLDHFRANELEQQATQIGLQAIEEARGTPWEELALEKHPQGSDPRVANPGPYLIGAPFGIENELILAGTNASGDPTIHSKGTIPNSESKTVDGTTYEVTNYVTEASASLRRVIVVVDWTFEGNDRSTFSSTLISSLSAP